MGASGGVRNRLAMACALLGVSCGQCYGFLWEVLQRGACDTVVLENGNLGITRRTPRHPYGALWLKLFDDFLHARMIGKSTISGKQKPHSRQKSLPTLPSKLGWKIQTCGVAKRPCTRDRRVSSMRLSNATRSLMRWQQTSLKDSACGKGWIIRGNGSRTQCVVSAMPTRTSTIPGFLRAHNQTSRLHAVQEAPAPPSIDAHPLHRDRDRDRSLFSIHAGHTPPSRLAPESGRRLHAIHAYSGHGKAFNPL